MKLRIGTGLGGLLLAGLLAAVLPAGASPAESGDASALAGQALARLKLTPEKAAGLARLALGCIERQYPNKPDHVMNDESEVRSPSYFHPAFYGCFDWHSSVHGHWMLVRLLKMYPELPGAEEIRTALRRNLSRENLTREAEYLEEPNRKSFERTYGWAWLLKLAEELKDWADPDGKEWSANLEPLTGAIVARYLDFLPRQTYPICTGVHPNTAFGLAFALDYARAAGRPELTEVLIERSKTYYLNDRNYPADWEPGGEDFFSPALMEADLMRRVLAQGEFVEWFRSFLPDLLEGGYDRLLEPAVVSDRTDPKIVHLDGLNLSRAWCMIGIASALPEADPERKILQESALRHAEDALAHITSGSYEGEHWLASFAVYLLSSMEGEADQ